MSGLPPWSAKDARDRRAMVRWVNWHLDQIDDAETEEWWQRQGDVAAGFDLRKHLAREAEEEATRGNIGPLRKLYPDIAEYIHLPRRERGKRFPKKNPRVEKLGFDPVQVAAKDVRRIREIWKKFYGRWRRKTEDGPTAEEIAAKRWDVDENAVVARLKKLPSK